MGLTQNIVELAAAPRQFFVRSGNAGIDKGGLRSSGAAGYYWSALSNSDERWAHYLGLYDSGVVPPGHGNRLFGFPLRCLVR